METNAICKYSKCSRGKNGERKRYYTCAYCTTIQSWRSVACCEEHYNLYIEEVLAARANGQIVDILPERTDMSKQEVKNMILNSSLEETKQDAIQELTEAGYGKYLQENGLSKTIEKVNDDIDTKAARKIKSRSRTKEKSKE